MLRIFKEKTINKKLAVVLFIRLIQRRYCTSICNAPLKARHNPVATCPCAMDAARAVHCSRSGQSPEPPRRPQQRRTVHPANAGPWHLGTDRSWPLTASASPKRQVVSTILFNATFLGSAAGQKHLPFHSTNRFSGTGSLKHKKAQVVRCLPLRHVTLQELPTCERAADDLGIGDDLCDRLALPLAFLLDQVLQVRPQCAPLRVVLNNPGSTNSRDSWCDRGAWRPSSVALPQRKAVPCPI
jgi:hypothetical protein